jgi:hypothetical protein
MPVRVLAVNDSIHEMMGLARLVQEGSDPPDRLAHDVVTLPQAEPLVLSSVPLRGYGADGENGLAPVAVAARRVLGQTMQVTGTLNALHTGANG